MHLYMYEKFQQCQFCHHMTTVIIQLKKHQNYIFTTCTFCYSYGGRHHTIKYTFLAKQIKIFLINFELATFFLFFFMKLIFNLMIRSFIHTYKYCFWITIFFLFVFGNFLIKSVYFPRYWLLQTYDKNQLLKNFGPMYL